jgi:hypothetical protein
MTTMPIRDVSLNVEVVGHDYPLALMHGGPGADLHSKWPFRACADNTVVFHGHRSYKSTMDPYGTEDEGLLALCLGAIWGEAQFKLRRGFGVHGGEASCSRSKKLRRSSLHRSGSR